MPPLPPVLRRALLARPWSGARLRWKHASSLKVANEPILAFTKGSPERDALQKALKDLKGRTEAIPCVVGDEEVWTSNVQYQVSPFNHGHKVAKFCYADKVSPWQLWAPGLPASQGKTVIQAEIDAAAELIDFFRFNAKFAVELEGEQPISVPPSTNSVVYRGLEGFVAAISPFNFTAIGGNLAGAPALMVRYGPRAGVAGAQHHSRLNRGKAALEPLSSQAWVLPISSCHHLLGPPPPLLGPLLASWAVDPGVPHLTFRPLLVGPVPHPPRPSPSDTRAGSLIPTLSSDFSTFKNLWKQVAQNLDRYRTFPRLAGECGGKNFHFVHRSADVDSVVSGTLRSAFEYSGQKCSACSRLYVPHSLWPQIKKRLLEEHGRIKVGDEPMTSPGDPHYILRWTSPQVIKETHKPLGDWRYSYMQ
ncbi:delta-1-pyrroline-5-carboxylate dehydrogenase, mitochondrial-like [Myotis lucifugus]|uniref:delta-1-pyrroline-5-carboxylate dehydrogenase, mitochondrial-like n=1 Tax=Myotis lucifugus TaxID=59463 RepID=UPI000CCC642A|nr:delta-1-pyrroline-5-carboxylate dehydrogenase, mitochondrial-like [Myotis lucifugus]